MMDNSTIKETIVNIEKETAVMQTKDVEIRPKAANKPKGEQQQQKTTKELMLEIIKREGWNNLLTFKEFKKILRK